MSSLSSLISSPLTSKGCRVQVQVRQQQRHFLIVSLSSRNSSIRNVSHITKSTKSTTTTKISNDDVSSTIVRRNYCRSKQHQQQQQQTVLPYQQQHFIINKNHRTNLIFGANTDVGKTVISTGLLQAAVRNSRNDNITTTNTANSSNANIQYIKPIQCGGGDGGDTTFINRYVNANNANESHVSSHNLFYFSRPASPHIASIDNDNENNDTINTGLADHTVITSLYTKLNSIQEQKVSSFSNHNNSTNINSTVTYIETAGGVLSPSASSLYNNSPHHSYITVQSNNSTTNNWGWSTQGDLYRPIATIAPVIVIGDSKLGGISTTLSCIESLLVRGYTIVAIIFLDNNTTTGIDSANTSTNTNDPTIIGHNSLAIESYFNTNTIVPFRSIGTASTGTSDSSTGSTILQPLQPLIVSFPSIPTDVTVPLYEWYSNIDVITKFNAIDTYLQNYWEQHVQNMTTISTTMQIEHTNQNDDQNFNTTTVTPNNTTTTNRILDRCSDNHMQMLEVSAITASSSSSSSSMTDKEDNLAKNIVDADGTGDINTDADTDTDIGVDTDYFQNTSSSTTARIASCFDASSGTSLLGCNPISLLLTKSAVECRYGYNNNNYKYTSSIQQHPMLLALCNKLKQAPDESVITTSNRPRNNSRRRRPWWPYYVILKTELNDTYNTAIQLGILTYQTRIVQYSNYNEMSRFEWVIMGQQSPPSTSSILNQKSIQHQESINQQQQDQPNQMDNHDDKDNNVESIEENTKRGIERYTFSDADEDGLFLIPPTIGYTSSGNICISFPSDYDIPDDVDILDDSKKVLREFDTINDVMDIFNRNLRNPKLKSIYMEQIELRYLVYEHKMLHHKVSSIIIEPYVVTNSSNNTDNTYNNNINNGIVQFIDPLWQHSLIELARRKNIPIIFDETNTSLYQIGYGHCRSILGRMDPDISISSPIASTLHSIVINKDVYDRVSNQIQEQHQQQETDTISNKNNNNDQNFDSNILDSDYSDISPTICTHAIHTIDAYRNWSMTNTIRANVAFENTKEDEDDNNKTTDTNSTDSFSTSERDNTMTQKETKNQEKFRSTSCSMLFDEEQVKNIALLPVVRTSFALGSILTVTFKDYDSIANTIHTTGAQEEKEQLAIIVYNQLVEQGILVRQHSNVISLVVSPLSTQYDCQQITQSLYDIIETL